MTEQRAYGAAGLHVLLVTSLGFLPLCCCLGLEIPRHGPPGTSFARQRDMELGRQEGDTFPGSECLQSRAGCSLLAALGAVTSSWLMGNRGWAEALENRAGGILAVVTIALKVLG